MSDESPSFKGRTLFKGPDTSFGIFYPTHYLIAAFDSHDTARRAEQTLRDAGYSDDEVDAVPPDYVIADIQKGTQDAGLLTRIEQQISSTVGTESVYWKEDLALARDGAGFLAVYCPTEGEAKRLVRLLKPMNPWNMRRYRPHGVVKLT